MKKIKCYDCDTEFTSDTEKGALDQMYPHYMEAHKEIIEGGTEAEKDSWMKKFHADWEAAPEA